MTALIARALTLVAPWFLACNLALPQGYVREDWTAVFREANESPRRCDYPLAVTIDDEGSVYVTGFSGDPDDASNGNVRWIIVKYDDGGNELWHADEKPGAGTAIVASASGDVYVAGSTVDAAVIVKYDSSGELLWERHTRCGEVDDFAVPIAVVSSPDGNVCALVSCFCEGRLFSGQVFPPMIRREPIRCSSARVVRYGPDGSARRPTLLSTLGLTGSGLGVDGSGNLYVAATRVDCCESFAPDGDIITIKLDRQGREVWQATYDESGPDYAQAIGVDPSGDVYVVGSSGRESVTIKYDAEGNEVWAARVDRLEEGGDGCSSATEIALDDSGAVYVAGHLNTGEPVVLTKYDESGRQLWVAAADDLRGGGEPVALAVDAEGNSYVGGRVSCAGDLGCDFGATKFSPEGGQLWTVTYDSRASMGGFHDFGGNDIATAMVIDLHGGVYITGASNGVSNALEPTRDSCYDFTTVKYAEVEPFSFLRGDCDGDGDACTGVNDALALLNWRFLGSAEPPCLAACDPDGNGDADLTDAIYGLTFCFTGTAAPAAPFPDCGPSTDADAALGCATPPASCE